MKVEYQGTEIDFTPPWRRITMLDAVREYSGIDFKTLTIEDSYNIAKRT